MQLGVKSFSIAGYSFKEMALVIPPVFVLLGLLDIWVPRETMMKYMGEGSGIIGIVLVYNYWISSSRTTLWSFSSSSSFYEKRREISNILIFIGAWSNDKNTYVVI